MARNKLHGLWKLPKGYSFVILPGDAKFEDDPEGEKLPPMAKLGRSITSPFRKGDQQSTVLSCSYNLLKIAAAVVQLIFAVTTLYRARGDQINQYGYAAFGLTVAPYAWMSLLNLLGNAMSPQYPSLFVVGSASLDKLRAKVKEQGLEAEFPLSGAVGRITPETEQRLQDYQQNWHDSTKIRLSIRRACHFGLAVVPIAVVGGLSGFQPAGSAVYQRVWTMMWLVFGSVLGPLMRSAITPPRSERMQNSNVSGEMSMITTLLFYGVPAIGGLVVVGQMITEYGVCNRLVTGE